MLTALLVIAGSLAALSVLYLLVLAAVAVVHRSRPLLGVPSHRLVVLVPAHDEQDLIGRCVDSLQEQDYPVSLHRILVIADNCGDKTAEVAAAHGAEVMVRDDRAHPGKGHALRWAMDQLLAGSRPVDAVVVV